MKKKITLVLTTLVLFGISLKAQYGKSYTAWKAEAPLVVDGMIDPAWDNVNSELIANWFGKKSIVPNENIDSTDMYGTFKMMWDEDNLYVFFHAVDDSIFVLSEWNWYQSDGVEFAFDMDYSNDIDSVKEGYGVFVPATPDVWNPSNAFNIDTFDIGITEGQEWWIEATIPWDSINEGFMAMNNKLIGMEVLHADRDSLHPKDHYRAWSADTNQGGVGINAVENFGALVLREKDYVLESNITDAPVVVDGAIDPGWADIEFSYVNTWVGHKNFPDEAPSPTDRAGMFKTRWDQENFYFLFSAVDDSIAFHENILTENWRVFNSDGVEVFFDLLNDSKADSLFDDGVDDGTGVFNPFNNDLYPAFKDKHYNVDTFDIIIDGTNWAIEVAIPWSNIGDGTYVPSPGETMGFEVMHADRDITQPKDHYYAWNGAPEYWGSGKPASWGNILFSGNLPTKQYQIQSFDGELAVDGAVDAAWSTIASADVKNWVGKDDPNKSVAADDASGSFKAMWDYYNFYFLFEATDDSVNIESGNQYWMDGVELMFDLMNDGKIDSTKDDNDVNGAFNPGFVGDGAFGLEQAQIDYNTTNDSWFIEVAVPWVNIMPDTSFTPSIGKLIGFEVMFADEDSILGSSDRKDHYFAWNGTESYKGAGKPASWGELLFAGAEPSKDMITLTVNLIDTVNKDLESSDAQFKNSWNGSGEYQTSGNNVFLTDDNDDNIWSTTAQLVPDFNNIHNWKITFSTVIDTVVYFSVYDEANITINLLVPSTVGFNEIDQIARVYPVPTSDFLQVSSTSIIQSIEMMDITGKIARKLTDINSMEYTITNLSEMEKGMYILKVNTDRDSSINKIIIE